MTKHIFALDEALRRLREKRGIVHQITNIVTVRDCANVVLAVGASPIMADHPEEVEEMTAISSALVVNIGTIQPDTPEAVERAGKTAGELGIPFILDPVGVGATKLRRDFVRHVLETLPVTVLRGNAGEIQAVYANEYVAGGVDAPAEAFSIKEAALEVARRYHTVVAVTGEVDVVTDGQELYTLHNGTDWLPRLTGTGCMTSALVGSFATANDGLTAAAAGISYMSVCGERAFERLRKNEGLGSFSIYLHDELGRLKPKKFIKETIIDKEEAADYEQQ